jgi:hypothetical protein
MLALLKLWRTITDLKESNQLFKAAFQTFISSAPPHILSTIDNIQFFHDCTDKASTRRSTDDNFVKLEQFEAESLDNTPEPTAPNGQGKPYELLISEQDIT